RFGRVCDARRLDRDVECYGLKCVRRRQHLLLSGQSAQRQCQRWCAYRGSRGEVAAPFSRLTTGVRYMKTTAFLVSAAAALGVTVGSAHAIPRSFVSGAGAGTTCTRAAPCATFQAAHNATDPGGEVNCIDPGDFGAVTITKSITIDCTGTLGTIRTGGT